MGSTSGGRRRRKNRTAAPAKMNRGSAPKDRDLAPYAPPAEAENKAAHERLAPMRDSRLAIHVGAPVASQQSRILRVDQTSVAETSAARTFPAAESTAVARRT